MDCILIEDLRVAVRIGVYPHEKHGTQMVSLDLEIGLPGTAMFQTDSIDDTIDYGEVAVIITTMGVSKHYSLVEHFADRIATMLIDDFRAPWVKVRAAKIGVIPGAKFVGVSIERTCSRLRLLGQVPQMESVP